MQKLMEQYERMMEEAMKELERLEGMDELSEEMGLNGTVSMDPEDLELMKRSIELMKCGALWKQT